MWSIKNVEKTEVVKSISSEYLEDRDKLISNMKSNYLATKKHLILIIHNLNSLLFPKFIFASFTNPWIETICRV